MRRSQEIASQADEDFRSNLLMSSDHQNCARVKNYFDKQHTYATSSGLRFTLTSYADGLFLTALDQPALRLFPRSEADYFAEAIDAEISMVKDENGAANGLLFRQNGRELRAEKQV